MNIAKASDELHHPGHFRHDPQHNADGGCLYCKDEQTDSCELCGQRFMMYEMKYHGDTLIVCWECYRPRWYLPAE